MARPSIFAVTAATALASYLLAATGKVMPTLSTQPLPGMGFGPPPNDPVARTVSRLPKILNDLSPCILFTICP
jgi:hypothetical protein